MRYEAEHLQNVSVKFGNRVWSQEMMNIGKNTVHGAQGVQYSTSSIKSGNRASNEKKQTQNR